MLEALSKSLSADDMKRLAPQLDISQQEVNTRYASRCTDRAAVTAANHDLLSDWLNRQTSREEASVLMGEALIKAGLKLIAQEVLNYPPPRRENQAKSAIKWKRQKKRYRNQRKKQKKMNGLSVRP